MAKSSLEFEFFWPGFKVIASVLLSSSVSFAMGFLLAVGSDVFRFLDIGTLLSLVTRPVLALSMGWLVFVCFSRLILNEEIRDKSVWQAHASNPRAIPIAMLFIVYVAGKIFPFEFRIKDIVLLLLYLATYVLTWTFYAKRRTGVVEAIVRWRRLKTNRRTLVARLQARSWSSFISLHSAVLVVFLFAFFGLSHGHYLKSATLTVRTANGDCFFELAPIVVQENAVLFLDEMGNIYRFSNPDMIPDTISPSAGC